MEEKAGSRSARFAPDTQFHEGTPRTAISGSLPPYVSTLNSGEAQKAVAVPRLDDLIVKALAENYDVYPALDRIPAEYVDSVVALLDPKKINYLIAVQHISNEKFWQRLCNERWPLLCSSSSASDAVAQHGHSYKRMFVERHVQHLIETFQPSSSSSSSSSSASSDPFNPSFSGTASLPPRPATSDPLALTRPLTSSRPLTSALRPFTSSLRPQSAATVDEPITEEQQQQIETFLQHLEVSVPFTQRLIIDQLPSRLDLGALLTQFSQLASLQIKYGAASVGMDYDPSLFGMQLPDALSLAHLFISSKTLHTVILRENLLNDDVVQVLVSGLLKNNTITHLDLSHNKIDDAGAAYVSRVLGPNSVLTHLDLSDNMIHSRGATALALALNSNQTLRSLSLRQNPLSEASDSDDSGDGVIKLLSTLARNTSLTHLDLASTDLAQEASNILCSVLPANKSLVTLDLASNELVSKGADWVGAIEKNSSLTHVDLRLNSGLDAEVVKALAALLAKRAATSKQSTRKALQASGFAYA